MEKFNQNISKMKYETLKKNVHLMSVQNKKTEQKVNYKRDDIKCVSQDFFYFKNDLISLGSAGDIAFLTQVKFARSKVGKVMIAAASMMMGVPHMPAQENKKTNDQQDDEVMEM